jgi:NADPH-dependent ferric siderophore reductase
VVEVADARDRVPLESRATLEVAWLWRGQASAGTSHALLEAVRALDLDASTYAWGGAERRVIGAIGKHLRRERGLPGACVSMTGYWRRDG